MNQSRAMQLERKIAPFREILKQLTDLPCYRYDLADEIIKRSEIVIIKGVDEPSLYLSKLRTIDFRTSFLDDAFSLFTLRRYRFYLAQVELENLIRQVVVDIQTEKVIQINRILFLVHGHDDAMKQSVARAVEILGLEALILHEQPSRGRTIIEKFTDYSNVGFAIILLSPDDLGYENNKVPIVPRPRARQNVILEMGFFLGKLGRERVFVLYPDYVGLELPSVLTWCETTSPII